MSQATPPTPLVCPFDPAFECRWAGDALPPDGTPPARSTDTRCPPGYLPHRRSPAVELQGKVVVTGRPATHRPNRPDDAADATGEPDEPGAPAR